MFHRNDRNQMFSKEGKKFGLAFPRTLRFLSEKFQNNFLKRKLSKINQPL